MSTLLVTGGGGFVLGHLVRHWASLDPANRVVVLDATPLDPSVAAFFEPAARQISFIQGDVSDAATWDRLQAQADGISHIVHGAAVTSIDRLWRAGGLRGVVPAMATNLIGVAHALGYAGALPNLQRFIFVSSGSVYDSHGHQAPGQPLPEDGSERLDRLIAALLNTGQTESILQTRAGIANAKGKPFDQSRIDRFAELARYLDKADLTSNAYNYSKSGWRNLTFFESYFSNFIEGTEFTIEEAEEIAFEHKVIYERHEDSHDILAHIEISGELSEMHRVPENADELIDILKIRHGLLLAERPDKRPGLFKVKPNRAGGTDFVLPELVEGTLVQGFDIYRRLPRGIKRSIFIHFMVSEVHPFDDGNGRISRIMMNSELVSCDQHKLIVPTVQRDSYLNGLRTATRQRRFRTMVKVLHQLQCYSASLDWGEYDEIKLAIQENAADKEPDEGTTLFNKVIAKLGGSYPAG